MSIQTEFYKKLQTKIHKITKDLDVNPMGLEPPKGTNGAVSSGSLTMDLITGGGFPKKRMTTIAGVSGSGKSTIVQKSLGLELKKGTLCHYEDQEGAADHQWMLRGGSDVNQYLGKRGTPKTFYYIPDMPSGDSAFRYISRMQDAIVEVGGQDELRHASVFYLDSIHACVPESILDNDEKGNQPDLAIMLNKFVPLVRTKLAKSNCCFVAINQIKENPRAMFGSPEYEPGGSAPTYYADVKIRLTRVSKPKDITLKKEHPFVITENIRAGGIHEEKNPDGTMDRYIYSHVKTIKNRVFSPLKETYFRIWAEENGGTGRGVDPVWDVIRFFEEIGEAKCSKGLVTLKGKEYDYFDLKYEIIAKPDLYAECRELLENGKAFEKYFHRLAGGGDKLEAPTPELGAEVQPSEES